MKCWWIAAEWLPDNWPSFSTSLHFKTDAEWRDEINRWMPAPSAIIADRSGLFPVLHESYECDLCGQMDPHCHESPDGMYYCDDCDARMTLPALAVRPLIAELSRAVDAGDLGGITEARDRLVEVVSQ